MGTDKRPPIPEEIKRLLRQEARFGCCKCGYPILEYHHIIEYSNAPVHEPKDMMVLCSRCHDRATAHVYLEQDQRVDKDNPFNLRQGLAQGLLEILPGQNEVFLGGNYFDNNGPLVTVDGEMIVGVTVESNVLLLSLNLYDQDDKLIGVLDKNEWVVNPSDTWDVETSYQFLRLRQGQRKIQLSVSTVGPRILITGKLWRKGQRIRLGPSQLQIDGVVKGMRMINCHLKGIPLKIDTIAGSVSI